MLSSKEMPNSSRRDSSLKYDCPTVDSSFESSELSNSSDSNNEYQYFTFRKNTPSRLSFTQNTTNCADDISFVHQVSPCSSLNQLEDDDYGGDEYFNDKEEKLSNASAYPSGRMPLIQVAQTRQTQGQEEKSEEDIMEIASDNMSWLSKAFCILPTSSTLDTVQDTCYNEAVTKETFDDEVCFMSDERDDVIETTTTRDLEERVSAPFEDAHRIEVVNTIEEANPPRDEEGVSSSSCENMYNGLFQHELITCHSWHNWREEEEVQFTERSVSPEFPTRISKHPHNRSTNPSSRKNKIKNLSFNLTPFDHGGYESNEDECILPNQKYKPIDMKRKIVSFPTKMRKAKADPTTADHKSVKGCEWQLNVINSCGAFGQSEEEVEDVHSNDFYDDDDLGYDSDPNEILQNFAGETRNSNNHRHKLPMSLIPYNIEEGNIDEGEAFHMVRSHFLSMFVHGIKTILNVFYIYPNRFVNIWQQNDYWCGTRNQIRPIPILPLQ